MPEPLDRALTTGAEAEWLGAGDASQPHPVEAGGERGMCPGRLAQPSSADATPWIVSMPYRMVGSPSVITPIENLRPWPSSRSI